MSDWSHVTIQIDEDGEIVEIKVDGEIDRTHLTEERPEAKPLPEDPNAGRTIWPLG